jgi:hypothetical protein
MVGYTCNLSTQEAEISLGYRASPYLKKKKQQKFWIYLRCKSLMTFIKHKAI